MNNVSLIGRLVRDPELRYTTSQTAVGTFTIAVDRQKKENNGPSADFIRISAFGKTAENCARYLSKGRQIAITGSIRTGSYKNKEGNTIYTTDVVARSVEFLAGGNKNSQGNNGQSGQNGYSGQTGRGPDPAQGQYYDDLPPGFEAIDEEDIPF